MHNTRKIELLAPARNKQVAISAINSGADAVYIGPPNFGARHDASNSIADISDVVEYAHKFGVRVYVTFNTILMDDELDVAQSLINQLYDIGVDALIVQDYGIFRLDIPPIALHASTQCDIRTVEKAQFLEKIGLSQIVLARELSLNEIESISSAVNVPIEVFVHGALCVSYSGKCHASAYFKSRSANRGECSQICRLPYDLVDSNGAVIIKKRHLLSLRDLNQSQNLEKLIQAGASSFKIEGRLKDENYVVNVVQNYRRILDDIIQRSNGSLQRSSFGTTVNNIDGSLSQSFNRGFTPYFLVNRTPENGYNMASLGTPKSIGQPIGSVVRCKGKELDVKTKFELHNGDGLSYFNDDGIFEGFRINSADGNGNGNVRLRLLNSVNIKPGTQLFRTYDKQFDDTISAKQPMRYISVDMHLIEEKDKISLQCIDERGLECRVTVTTDCKVADKSQLLNQRTILSKLGGTIYRVGNVSTLENSFIPASVLANARREALKIIDELNESSYVTDIRRSEDLDAKYPLDVLPFNENVSNKKSELFLKSHGAVRIEPAIETKVKNEVPNATVLMTTRYCIRRELGMCKKICRNDNIREPLFLKSQNGVEMQIEFDCANCEMKLLSVKG